jgi:hypothetical protein
MSFPALLHDFSFLLHQPQYAEILRLYFSTSVITSGGALILFPPPIENRDKRGYVAQQDKK